MLVDGLSEGEMLGEIELEIEGDKDGEAEPAFGSEKSSKYKSSVVPPPFNSTLSIPVEKFASGVLQSDQSPHAPSSVLYLYLNFLSDFRHSTSIPCQAPGVGANQAFQALPYLTCIDVL